VLHPRAIPFVMQREPNAKHALLVAPCFKFAALLRLIDGKPSHDRETIGIFLRRFEAVIDAVAFPRGRNEDRMLDAGLLHHRAEFLMCQRLRKMRLATGHPGAVRRFRWPDVHAGINDHHYRSPYAAVSMRVVSSKSSSTDMRRGMSFCWWQKSMMIS